MEHAFGWLVQDVHEFLCATGFASITLQRLLHRSVARAVHSFGKLAQDERRGPIEDEPSLDPAFYKGWPAWGKSTLGRAVIQEPAVAILEKLPHSAD